MIFFFQKKKIKKKGLCFFFVCAFFKLRCGEEVYLALREQAYPKKRSMQDLWSCWHREEKHSTSLCLSFAFRFICFVCEKKNQAEEKKIFSLQTLDDFWQFVCMNEAIFEQLKQEMIPFYDEHDNLHPFDVCNTFLPSDLLALLRAYGWCMHFLGMSHNAISLILKKYLTDKDFVISLDEVATFCKSSSQEFYLQHAINMFNEWRTYFQSKICQQRHNKAFFSQATIENLCNIVQKVKFPKRLRNKKIRNWQQKQQQTSEKKTQHTAGILEQLRKQKEINNLINSNYMIRFTKFLDHFFRKGQCLEDMKKHYSFFKYLIKEINRTQLAHVFVCNVIQWDLNVFFANIKCYKDLQTIHSYEERKFWHRQLKYKWLRAGFAAWKQVHKKRILCRNIMQHILQKRQVKQKWLQAIFVVWKRVRKKCILCSNIVKNVLQKRQVKQKWLQAGFAALKQVRKKRILCQNVINYVLKERLLLKKRQIRDKWLQAGFAAWNQGWKKRILCQKVANYVLKKRQIRDRWLQAGFAALKQVRKKRILCQNIINHVLTKRLLLKKKQIRDKWLQAGFAVWKQVRKKRILCTIIVKYIFQARQANLKKKKARERWLFAIQKVKKKIANRQKKKLKKECEKLQRVHTKRELWKHKQENLVVVANSNHDKNEPDKVFLEEQEAQQDQKNQKLLNENVDNDIIDELSFLTPEIFTLAEEKNSLFEQEEEDHYHHAEEESTKENSAERLKQLLTSKLDLHCVMTFGRLVLEHAFPLLYDVRFCSPLSQKIWKKKCSDITFSIEAIRKASHTNFVSVIENLVLRLEDFVSLKCTNRDYILAFDSILSCVNETLASARRVRDCTKYLITESHREYKIYDLACRFVVDDLRDVTTEISQDDIDDWCRTYFIPKFVIHALISQCYSSYIETVTEWRKFVLRKGDRITTLIQILNVACKGFIELEKKNITKQLHVSVACQKEHKQKKMKKEESIEQE